MRQISQAVVKAEEQEEHEGDLGVDECYQIPDELWKRTQLLLPPTKKRKNKDRPRRPRMDNWKAINAIFYIARTDMQWKALPKKSGILAQSIRRV